MSRFGESEFVGDFLGGKPGEIKHTFGSGGDSRLDVFLGGFSDQGFDGPVEVIRTDIQHFRVLGSGMPLGKVVFDQGLKLPEDGVTRLYLLRVIAWYGTNIIASDQE